MDKIVKWGRRFWNLIPGLSVIFKNLWLPSEISHSLVGGILEAIGIMTLVIFEINNQTTKARKGKSNKGKAIFFLLTFLFVLLGYIGIYDSQVVYNPKYDITVLIPFWKSDDLQFMIENSQSAESAIVNYGPEAIREAIQKDTTGFTGTKIIFIISYLLIFESLIIAFSYIALDTERKIRSKK